MTKAVLLSLLVLVVVLLWRGSRRAAGERRDGVHGPAQAPPVASRPTVMVRCQVCGLHLARTDAIVAPSGSYCSDSHYRQGQP